MRRNDSSAAAHYRWFTVSLTSYRPESSVWTWLAVAGLLGAIALALVGIPSIDIHGPLHYAGIMDPFCGATRSVYLTMRCQFDNALRYNPGAPLLLLVAAGLVLRGAVGWWTGRGIYAHMPRRAVIAVAIAVGIALAVRQQSNAALLMAPWTGGWAASALPHGFYCRTR
jgi:Protein of unknown function (DUF2752)